MPWAVQIALGAVLLVVVLGGVTCGVFLGFALILRRTRPDRPDAQRRLVRRAAQSATVLGVLTIVYPIASVLGGGAWTYGSTTLVTAGLLLLALAALIRSRLA